MSQQALIQYHTHWRPSGYQPGADQGQMAGPGEQLRSVVMLRDNPDPRRLDLLISVRDPFEHLWVKDFYLNTAIKVVVLIDTSASMGYVGEVSRFQVVQDIVSQLAISVYRSGDAFGLYMGAEKLNKKLMLPPKPNRSAWVWVNEHLPKVKPQGKHIEGLIKATAYLPQRPCLVFVISDFRWPEEQLNTFLRKLNHHHVVPIMLQDPAEVATIPDQGIGMLHDMETGRKQFVWLRSSLKRKLQRMQQQHYEFVTASCRRFSMRPFVVQGEFKSDLLTEYFKKLI
jgi:uncharacterized protein (DUF58 family)